MEVTDQLPYTMDIFEGYKAGNHCIPYLIDIMALKKITGAGLKRFRLTEMKNNLQLPPYFVYVVESRSKLETILEKYRKRRNPEHGLENDDPKRWGVDLFINKH